MSTDRRTYKHGVISPAVQSRQPQTQYWVYHHHHYHHLGISSALVTVYEQRCITAVHKNIKSKSQSHWTLKARRTLILKYRSYHMDWNWLNWQIFRFVVDLLYDLFLQLFSSWQDYDWHNASRGPSAVAELLVLYPWGRLGKGWKEKVMTLSWQWKVREGSRLKVMSCGSDSTPEAAATYLILWPRSLTFWPLKLVYQLHTRPSTTRCVYVEKKVKSMQLSI